MDSVVWSTQCLVKSVSFLTSYGLRFPWLENEEKLSEPEADQDLAEVSELASSIWLHGGDTVLHVVTIHLYSFSTYGMEV